jgi:hypothetical protein
MTPRFFYSVGQLDESVRARERRGSCGATSPHYSSCSFHFRVIVTDGGIQPQSDAEEFTATLAFGYWAIQGSNL